MVPLRLRVAVIVLALLPATAALCATTDSGALEDIVVTAQKRTESAQEVPVSIETLSGAALERLNQATLLSIAGSTPALQYSEAGGEAQLYIRGVGSNLLAVGADPSVAVNLDGVYQGRPGMALNQFLDVDRVEILRGPQGTLYGRNATGGAVNLISRMPTQDWEGYATLGTGSFDRQEFKGAIGGPLSEDWSFRLAGRYEKDNGYVENLDPAGSDLNGDDLKATRAILRFQPNPGFQVTGIFDWSDFSNGDQAIIPLDDLGAAQLLGAVPTGSLLEERNDLPTFLKWKTFGPTVNLQWDVADHVTLTSISGYAKFRQDFLFNTDGTEIDVTRTTEHFDTNQISEELRLASRDTERLEWIGGLYFFKESKDYELGLVRANLAPGGIDPFGKATFLIPAINDDKSYAGFGQLTYKITDTVRATAGLRYSQEHKDDFNDEYFVYANAVNPVTQVLRGLYGNFVLPAAAAMRTGEHTWDAYTPKFGLEWQPQDHVMLYASYTKGFKSGGYNDNQPSNPVYNPEYVKSYEIGAKTDWLDQRLRANVAVFHYDYSDLQVSSFLNSLTFVTNAAQAKVDGVDLDLSARPVQPLELGTSLSFLRAKYDTFLTPYGTCAALVESDPSCAGIAVGHPRIINAAGNYLNNAPRFKGVVHAQYQFSLGEAGTVTAFGQASYTDEVFFNAANDPDARQGGYALYDAQLAYDPTRNWQVAAYGKNLANKEYVYNIVQFTSTSNPPSLPGPGGVITDRFSVGNSLGYPAPGRTWGLEATYRF
jgi:iron complex outermembrane receptor protein